MRENEKPAKETPPGSRARAVRARLEQTRADFHRLLEAVPEQAWGKRGSGSAWRVREEMWHIAWGMRFMLSLIQNARHGVGLFKPPMPIADRLNVLYTRLRSAGASRQSIARRYDRTHAAILATLESMREGEWGISVTVFDKRQTIEGLFLGIAHHFEEHAARIRPWLGDP